MDVDSDISTVLGTIRQEVEDEEVINLTYQLEDYSERKLWHQLTISLDEFYQISSKELKVQIYNQFINRICKKLNSIKVTDFLLSSFGDNKEECLDKLLELDGKIDDYQSSVYNKLQISRYYILLEKIEESNSILDELEVKFNSINNEFNSKINSAYYLTKCQYYKFHENYNLFYSNGLLYLSTLEDLNDINKLQFAFDLSIAALLGDKIYNFGELILHDILNSLKNDDTYNWLYSLIINLNSGNLSEFNKYLTISFQKYPKLNNFDIFLKQKIIIMSLVELISVKSTLNKTLTFKEISDFTSTDINDVEHLVIKCFSLNLFKGTINQIDEILTITWLQPRILNLDQIKTLYNHLKSWDSNVETLANDIHQNGGSIWAQS